MHGFERVVVVCRDTDVLVLLHVFHFRHQLSREIWFKSGTKKDPKHVLIHEMKLDASLRSVLPAFHALTGCDTVSQFAGIGKVTAWKAFENNSQLLTGLGCGWLTTETIDNVEAFVCKIHCSKELKEHLTFFPLIAMLITPKFNPNFKATDNN